MNGFEMRAIRQQAGMSCEELAAYLNLGPNGERTVRRLEGAGSTENCTGPQERLMQILSLVFPAP